MEVVLKNQCNTLGSILREQLENNCDGEFASCTVPEVTSDFLLVTTPSIHVLRKSLLDCKDELKKLEQYLTKNSKKETSKRSMREKRIKT